MTDPAKVKAVRSAMMKRVMANKDVRVLDFPEVRSAATKIPAFVSRNVSALDHKGFGTKQMPDGRSKFLAGVTACAKKIAPALQQNPFVQLEWFINTAYPTVPPMPWQPQYEIYESVRTFVGALIQGVIDQICQALGEDAPDNWPVPMDEMIAHFDVQFELALRKLIKNKP